MAELPWEDSLLERKLQSDLKDLLKCLVAFANSVRPGHVAAIIIGEKDDGSVQGVDNADNIQKTVRDTCSKIYPLFCGVRKYTRRKARTASVSKSSMMVKHHTLVE